MLLSGLSIVQEFAIIMLRTAVCGNVPTDLQPVLQYLFTEFFDSCPFGPRLLAAKVFLEVLLTADETDVCEWLSLELPNVGFVRGHLTFNEECRFAPALEIIDELLPHNEDSVEPDPLLHNLSVTLAEMSKPEDEIPRSEIRSTAVFFALDQFACRWQQREDVAPLIQQLFTCDDISEMVTSESECAVEFGLIMLRLRASNEVEMKARPFLRFVFLEVFPFAPPLFRLYIAKIYLTIALNRGASMYLSWVPMTIASDVRESIQGNLTNFEEEHYRISIRILEDLLRRQRLDDERAEPSEAQMSD
jgi:hypothetical protein